MESPYNDKNGVALSLGDKLTGSTNFDTIQGYVSFDSNGSNDFEKWRITIIKHFSNGKWVDGFNYTLHLAYHIDENNNCTSYEKIKEFV